MLLESTFYQLFCVKCSFKLVTLSKSYAINQSSCCFFLNTVYIDVHLQAPRGARAPDANAACAHARTFNVYIQMIDVNRLLD